MKYIKKLTNDWYMREAFGEGEWLACSMPSVVQEVLFVHNLLDGMCWKPDVPKNALGFPNATGFFRQNLPRPVAVV